MQIVFIHGSGATAKVWKYQSDHYPDSIAITLPGHPEGELMDSIPAMAAWLKAHLDKLEVADPVLIGHSLGGGVALQYALDYPDDVRAIVVIGSGGRLRVHPDTLGFLKHAVTNPAPFAKMIDNLWLNVSEDFASELKDDSMLLGPETYLNDLVACDQFDVMDRLQEIDAPTLAIVGTGDIMTPVKYARFLSDRMPNAQVKTIEGGTHYVLAEYPDEVNSAIDAFLGKH